MRSKYSCTSITEKRVAANSQPVSMLALTVEGRTGQFDWVVLGGDKEHTIDVWLCIHAAPIDEEL